jgi:transcriptional regulator with XRE-family HTH domain
VTPAELVRNARNRHGLSQRALAVRAGTTQAWISAIERGQARPSVETLRRLLLVMEEELVLDSRPLTSDVQEAIGSDLRPPATDADQKPIALGATGEDDRADGDQEVLAWMRLGPLGLSGVDAG